LSVFAYTTETVNTMPEMYYKTPKGSETGKKFAALESKINKSKDAIKKLGEKFGFDQYRGDYHQGIIGYFSSICFDSPPNENAWRIVRTGEYMPKLSAASGRKIQSMLDAVPKVEDQDANDCINFKSDGSKVIGMAFPKASDFYLFYILSEWGIDVPSDCEEITYSQYNQLSATEA
jgi:hypothetical protein